MKQSTLAKTIAKIVVCTWLVLMLLAGILLYINFGAKAVFSVYFAIIFFGGLLFLLCCVPATQWFLGLCSAAYASVRTRQS